MLDDFAADVPSWPVEGMGSADKPGVVAPGDEIETIDGVASDRSRPPLVKVVAPPQADYPALVTVDKSHYEIGESIGQGGMGHVFKARDRRVGRNVAIKELLPTSRENARRFEREARITARLQHPAIVHVYEAGVWPGGEPFYSMNYVAGHRLHDAIHAKSGLGGRLELLSTVIAVAEAIAYAHNENVIHRDLKPKNVLVGAFGETVVIDWGLAKDLGAPSDPQESLSMRRGDDPDETRARPLGTPAYMPPEQARGEAADRRADVYSIGALLYHVIAGVAPYASESSAQLAGSGRDRLTWQEAITLVKAAPCLPVDSVEPEAPVELVSIVTKAMARDPADRYEDAAQLAADLKAFQNGQLISARNYTRRELVTRWVTKHKVVLGVASTAVIVLAVFGTLSIQRILEQKRKEEQRRNTLLEERGRSELLAGQAGRAIAFLAEAAKDGEHDAARGLLIADAVRPFEARIARLRSLGTPDSIAFARDGTAFTIENQLHAWTNGIDRLYGLWQTHQQLLVAGDGRVITIDRDYVARVWSPAGTFVRELRGHTGDILDADLSASGRSLVTGSADGTARVWDLTSGSAVASKCSSELGVEGFPVTRVRFSPDGNSVVTATNDNVMCYWDASNGKPLNLMRGHTGEITSIRWAPAAKEGEPTRKLVLTASADGSVLLWNPFLGKPVIQPITHDGRAIASAEFSPDGRMVVTAGTDQVAHLWELPDDIPELDPSLHAKELRRFVGHASSLTTAVFDAGGVRIATAGVDNKAKVWDVATGELLATFEHEDVVRGVLFSPDGKRLLTASEDRTARLWDLERSAPRPHEVDAVVQGVAVAPDGSVAAARADSRVAVWRPNADEPQVLRDHAARVLAVAYSPDGAWLASGGEDSTALVVDATMLAKPRRLDGHAKPIRAIVFSADNRQVVTAGDEGIVRIWATATGALVRTLKHEAALTQLAISVDGTIAALDEQGRVIVWSSSSSTPQQPLQFDKRRSAIAFSSDGARFVASGTDTKIYPVFSGSIGLAQHILDGPTGEVRAVAFTRDGSAVITAGVDGLVQLWDAGKGKLLNTRGTRGATIHALATSPDGNTLWVGGEDQLVRGWDIHAEQRDPAQLGTVMARVPWRLDDIDVVRRLETGEED